MNFVLRYHGPLSGSSKGRQEEKHRIRQTFDRQLRALCERAEQFSAALEPKLHRAALHKGRISPPRDSKRNLKGPFFWRISVGGCDFVPLVTRPHELACEIEILWLRREKPGEVVRNGGDLDNRLKSLFDGLRMPLEERELPKSRRASGADPVPKPLICLLEDDALIQRFSVTTHALLDPMSANEDARDVDLILNVLVRQTYPMFANLGFPL